MRILIIVYDNDSYIHWFPQGVAYLAAVLQRAGIDVVIYNQDLHHYPEEHLKGFLNDNRFDFVGLSFIGGYYQYRKALKISEAINCSKNRPFYIIGGHGPSPEPEFFLRKTKADAVVIGEGEETVLELLEVVYRKNKPMEAVKGIAFYNEKDEFVQTERRQLISDIDSIPFPAYNLFPIEYYRLLRMPHCTNTDFVMPVLSGRGCTFKCNFCYRMDKGFRPRSSESIIEEIRFLKKTYNITYIAFSDELLMSSVKRTEELCDALLRAKLDVKWDCNGRLNYAEASLLRLMKAAGCVFINYGIEAMDDNVLRIMRKSLTVKQIVAGIEATMKAGISPGFNIIFGHIGDNAVTLKKGVEFLLKYDDGAQMRTIRPVTPYPGSPLYYYAIEKNFLYGVEDFYENKHLNSDLLSVNFTDLTDEEYYEELLKANRSLLMNYINNRSITLAKSVEDLYQNKNESFRGFRQS
ncbi:MAG: radical SAM protein [Deltaproteobacteria bacterium]|nr:radical SAM protein [Deltaproteobacteria bacterium]